MALPSNWSTMSAAEKRNYAAQQQNAATKTTTPAKTTNNADLVTGAAPIVSNSTRNDLIKNISTYTGNTLGQSASVVSNFKPSNVGYDVKAPTAPTPPTTNPITYGNGGGNAAAVVANQTNYYDDLMKAFMEQNSAQRQFAIDAILANLESVKGAYKGQIQKVVDDYQNLINENEVNRERTRRRIREDQANRGQLDAGLGRQERLNLDATYDTNQANLNSARENAVNEIYNLIAQAESEAKQNKAQVENNYANALLQWQLANQ